MAAGSFVPVAILGDVPRESTTAGNVGPALSRHLLRLLRAPQLSSDGVPVLLGAIQKELARVGPHGLDLGATVDTYARQIRLLLATYRSPTDRVSIRRLWSWLDEARLGSARLDRLVAQCDTCKIMVTFMMIDALQRKRQT